MHCVMAGHDRPGLNECPSAISKSLTTSSVQNPLCCDFVTSAVFKNAKIDKFNK